jgi:glycosyltransferase involved in cell wall biosynthesis
MDISVVVPTFNRREIVKRCLNALFAQSVAPSNFEIIVVVDGSTDGTADWLRQLRPACQLRVIEQEHRGPSAARNAGTRGAAGDWVLFLDDDMLADPGLVAAHLDAQRQRSRLLAFGSLYLSPDSPQGLAGECFNREIGAFYLERKKNPQAQWQIADCVFSNASLPRALLNEAGGFDEAFWKREDLELGVRLIYSTAGVRLDFIDKAVAYQYLEKTAAELIRDAEAFAVGDVMFARKHPHAVIKGQLNWLDHEPRWKRRMLRMAAAAPGIADFFLAPICVCGQLCSGAPALRKMGARALQVRRRIHWFHKVLELDWRRRQTHTKASP